MTKVSRYQDQKAASALANALTDLPENWLMCRDMRHAWAVVEDFHVEKVKGRTVQTVRRVLGCMRCATLRNEHYVMGRLGLDKTSQSYTYPDNYQLKGIPRGVKPSSIIQAEQYRRVMEKLAAAQKAG